MLLLLIIGVIGMLTYLKVALPNVGEAPELTVEITPERLERGKYLANHVNLCMDCHGQRDWETFSGPLVEGTGGKGGEIFNQDFGFPGAYYAKNITPFHLGDWTDGEAISSHYCGSEQGWFSPFSRYAISLLWSNGQGGYLCYHCLHSHFAQYRK